MDAAARVLITGRPGSGKTTLVERVVGRLDRPAGGFITRELRKQGRRVGFELHTLQGERAVMAHVDRAGEPRIGRYGVDLSVIEGLGVSSLQFAVAERRLVVVDEIGPMELLSKPFREAVQMALGAPVPFLGTIMSRGHPFGDQLKDREDLTILRLNRENRDRLLEQVLDRFTSGP